MNCTVRLDPGRVIAFEDLPPCTIALDGVVEGPHVDAAHKRFSFDHHGEYPRVALSATCRQVFDAVLLGLDTAGCTVLLDHLDGDSMLAAWILLHAASLKREASRERIRPLVDAIAEGDAHGPSYPQRHPELAATFHTRIMAPRRLLARDADKAVWGRALDACLSAMDGWWSNGLLPDTLEALPIPEYELRDFGSWACAITPATDARAQMQLSQCLYDQGYDRILMASPMPGSRWKYTLARRSDFVPGFDLSAMYIALNVLESSCDPSAEGLWGGTTTIGGSPRPQGSAIDPGTLMAQIEERLTRKDP